MTAADKCLTDCQTLGCATWVKHKHSSVEQIRGLHMYPSSPCGRCVSVCQRMCVSRLVRARKASSIAVAPWDDGGGQAWAPVGAGWWGGRTWDDMVRFSRLERDCEYTLKDLLTRYHHRHKKKNTLSCLLPPPSPQKRNVWANKRMKAKGEDWPELWMSQSLIAASLLVMQTESHSDCPTSQAKGWKTFTCKYEWPTSYCEHASYGILNAQRPQRTPAQRTCQSTALL